MFTRRAFLGAAGATPLLPHRDLLSFRPWQDRLIAAARAQIGVTQIYDPAYVGLDYPLGDVPVIRGVCSDVVIRAYRTAFEIDLQTEVHTDMAAHFSSYPKIWGLSRTDRNIDHRRVPNLETFLDRANMERDDHANIVSVGDLVSMRLGGRLPHIAIISSAPSRLADATIIHNIGAGTQEEAYSIGATAIRVFRYQPAT